MKMRTKLNELHDLRPLNNRAKISLKGGKGGTNTNNYTGGGSSSGSEPPPPAHHGDG